MTNRVSTAAKVGALAAGFVAASISMAAAQTVPPAQKPADVPGDIFGFTDAAGVDDQGKQGASVTTDGQFGKRSGSYLELASKYSFGRVLAPRTNVEVSLFSVWHSISNVTGIPINRSDMQFNGASVEIAYALMPRTVSNPFAVKIAFEPRWLRIDGTGRRAQAYQGEFKLAVDAPIIVDKLFWAANAVLGIQRANIAATPAWQTVSSLKVSTALALAVAANIFLGAEATYVRNYNNVLGQFTGHAVFLGPTVMAKLGSVTLSGTIAPQIAGKSKGVPGRIDLDNGARYISRFKLGFEF